MATVAHLDESNFDSKTKSGVALIDFWAPWCGPCKMLGPILDEVVEEIGDTALIAKINCDDAPQLATKFKVRSIPALFVLKDGEIVNQFIGVQSKQALIDAVNKEL
ncbi:MAG: thioredoxin [Verrucomicrobiota bacterium]|nr:thioredoxin [Verrucomicrobiota bacterium]